MKTKSILRVSLILLCCLFSISVWPQVSSKFGRSYLDTLPESFRLNTPELRNYIYSHIPDDIKKEQYPRSTFRYADQSSIQLSYLFSSGRVYSDWPILEDYLNKILQKVLPKELEEDSLIHIYVLKSGDYNAFMTPPGMMFLSIGVFDDVQNEATLASIIAHELAHYYLKHSIEAYVKEERGDFKPGFLLSNKGAYSKFSINNELQADSLAMIWLDHSGYHKDGMTASLKIIERQENNWLLQQQNIWEVTESTHPSSDNRIKKLEDFRSEKEIESGAYFLISEEKFTQLKEEAKPEILEYLIHGFDYYTCIEKAFKFHINDPYNAVYVYYLMEAIRRNGYLNSDIWRKPFIVDRYYEIVDSKSGKQKVKRKGHIFDKFPYEILCMAEEDAKNLKADFYWKGEVKFITYEQAFLFFNQIGELLEEPECILSNALSLSFDKEACDKLLRKYLEQDTIRYREYASNLLNGTIKSGLENKKLSVFSEFFVTIRQGKEEILVRNELNEEESFLNQTLKHSIESLENREYLYLPDQKKHHLRDYVVLKELEKFSFISLIAKGEKTEIHILDPDYWEVLNKYKVNEIEFINCSYYDSRKANVSLESYQEVININYDFLLSEVKRHRYLEAFITSIRAVENGVMKVKYYGDEEKLAFNKAGKEQVIDFLNAKLQLKDKRTEELDERYNNNK